MSTTTTKNKKTICYDARRLMFACLLSLRHTRVVVVVVVKQMVMSVIVHTHGIESSGRKS